MVDYNQQARANDGDKLTGRNQKVRLSPYWSSLGFPAPNSDDLLSK